MHRFLHIGFKFDGPHKMVELQPVFDKLADDWLRYAANDWVVWTDLPASDFYYALKPLIGPKDHMLIVGLNMNERNGWLPQWMWEWMDKKRQLGPPPAPARPTNELLALLGDLPLERPTGGLLGPLAKGNKDKG